MFQIAQKSSFLQRQWFEKEVKGFLRNLWSGISISSILRSPKTYARFGPNRLKLHICMKNVHINFDFYIICIYIYHVVWSVLLLHLFWNLFSIVMSISLACTKQLLLFNPIVIFTLQIKMLEDKVNHLTQVSFSWFQ